jgi:hypothetical protein
MRVFWVATKKHYNKHKWWQSWGRVGVCLRRWEGHLVCSHPAGGLWVHVPSALDGWSHSQGGPAPTGLAGWLGPGWTPSVVGIWKDEKRRGGRSSRFRQPRGPSKHTTLMTTPSAREWVAYTKEEVVSWGASLGCGGCWCYPSRLLAAYI